MELTTEAVNTIYQEALQEKPPSLTSPEALEMRKKLEKEIAEAEATEQRDDKKKTVQDEGGDIEIDEQAWAAKSAAARATWALENEP